MINELLLIHPKLIDGRNLIIYE